MSKQENILYRNENTRHSRVVQAAITGAALLGCSLATVTVGAATLVNEPKIAAAIEVSDPANHGSALSTVIRNASDKRVDSVELVVRYDWLWKDERNPGTDSPGWVDFVTLNDDLNPGDTATFTYELQRPLPQRDDGWFMPRVEVVGFTPYE